MEQMTLLINLPNLVYKYIYRGIFVDTEPLLVYIVGKHKTSELKNVGKYNEKDYEIISSFLSKFNKIIITPYIIAELSNLIGKKLNHSLFKEFIIESISVLKNFDERRLKKDIVTNRKEAQWLGFPDVSIIISSENKNSLVLSEDENLLRECRNLGIDCIDFTGLRAMNYN